VTNSAVGLLLADGSLQARGLPAPRNMLIVCKSFTCASHDAKPWRAKNFDLSWESADNAMMHSVQSSLAASCLHPNFGRGTANAMLQIDCFCAASSKMQRVLLQITRKELDSQDRETCFSDSKGCNSRRTSMVGVFFRVVAAESV
jgi:hypothetical protein